MTTPDPSYPIGKFEAKENYTPEDLRLCIDRINALPGKLDSAINGLLPAQLDTPYRDGGWTIRQVVHHVADSHMNAYIRVKWTITEDTPVVKVYLEKAWAVTPETSSEPALSLALLKALHAKWVTLLRTLTAENLQREFIHPDTKKHVRIDRMIAMYAWHGDHHLAHITSLKERMKW